MVARRRVDLLLVDQPRHRRHERRVPRARRRRHADGGGRRSLHQRVLRRASPDGTRARDHRARRPRRASGGATAAATSTKPRVWLLRGTARRRVTSRSRTAAPRRCGRCGAADGKSLFYVSDRSGAQNLWARPFGRRRRRSSSRTFKNGRVLWPSISNDGRPIAFERDFEIWTLDTQTGKRGAVPITRRGAPAGAGVEHLTLTDGFTELALSPDGKKVAFVARGEVFAACAKDGGDAAARHPHAAGRVADRPGRPTAGRSPTASDRDGTHAPVPLRLRHQRRDAADQRRRRGSLAARSRRTARVSRSCAATASSACSTSRRAQERVMANGIFDRPPFAGGTRDRLVAGRPVAGLSRRPARRGSRTSTSSPAAGGDAAAGQLPRERVCEHPLLEPGRHGRCSSIPGQRTEMRQIARVDLMPRTPQFREDQFRDLFKEEPREAGAAVQRRHRRRRAPTPAAAPTPRPRAKPARESGTRDRLRRHPPAPVAPAGRRRRRRAARQPGRQDAAAHRPAPRASTNLYTFSLDELSREPAGGAPADVDVRRQERRRVHARRQGGVSPRDRAASTS